MDTEGIRAMSDAYPQSSDQYNDFDYDPFAHNYDNSNTVEPPTNAAAAPRASPPRTCQISGDERPCSHRGSFESMAFRDLG